MSLTLVIDTFENEFRFLSNYYPASVQYDGSVYPSVEHAYQAAKTLDLNTRRTIRMEPDPDAAKRLGRASEIREDWEQIKLSVMASLIREKFEDMHLAQQLLLTGNAELVEENSWGDTFWGKCEGVGSNHVGRILMDVRSEIREQVTQHT